MAENVFNADPTGSNPLNYLEQAFGTVYPNIPSSTPPGVNINNNIAGNFDTGPNPGKNYLDQDDKLNSIADAIYNASEWAYNPNQYGRAESYGAGYLNSNFERYYTHPLYQKLGFSPFRDNEAIYNANSTWSDDFVRMTGQMGGLYKVGWASFYDIGSEDTSNGFEKAMAVGNTTKGGVGGFFTNLTLNSMFTLGIASEILAENAAIAAMTYATGGLAAPAAALRLGRIGEGLSAIKKAVDYNKGLKSTGHVLNTLKDPLEAKRYFDSVQAASNTQKFLNFANPLREVTAYTKNLASGANGFREMNNFVKTRKAFGAFYRDLREINLVVSESMMEGNMARNHNNSKALDDFYNQNSRMPDGKEAEDIYDKSNNVGFATSMWNMPVIFITNRIVFDDLLRGFKAPSVLAQETISGSARHFARNKNWKVGQDVYDFAKDTSKLRYAKKLFTSGYSPLSRKYAAGNIAEGLQETFQDIASEASNLYYERKYKDPMAAGLVSALSAVGTATSDQFSIKGLETFLSGFLMGSIVGGVGGVGKTIMTKTPGAYRSIFKGEVEKGTEEYKKAELNIKEAANAILQDPTGNAEKIIDNALTARYLSNQMSKAQQENNQLAFHDAKDEMLFNHLWTLASSKKTGLITEWTNDMVKLDDASIAEAFGVPMIEGGNVKARLISLKNRVDDFQKTYDMFTREFKNPFQPFKLTSKDAGFEDELLNYVAFNNAVKDAVIAKSLLGKTLERKQDLYNELTSSPVVKNANASDINILLNTRDLDTELKVLKNEISVLSIGDKDQKREARIKQKRLDTLEDFRNTRLDYNNYLDQVRQTLADLRKKAPSYKVGSKVINKRTGADAKIVSVKGNMLNVRYKDGTVKRISKNAVETSREAYELDKGLESYNKSMYKAYRNYVNVLSEQYDSRLNDDVVLDDAFIKIRDSFTLDKQTEHLTKVLNMLNNPEMFMEHARRNAESQKIKRANFANYIVDSFDALVEQHKDNDFLNKLFDLKATIDPQDAEKIIKDGDVSDVIIYDATTGMPINEQDKRYEQIKKIVEEFAASKRKQKEAAEGEKVEDTEEVTQERIDAANDLMELVKAENEKRKQFKDAKGNPIEPLLVEDLNDDVTKDWLDNSPEAQEALQKLSKPAPQPPPAPAPPAAPAAQPPAPAAPAPAAQPPVTPPPAAPAPAASATPSPAPKIVQTEEAKKVKKALEPLNDKKLELVEYVIGEDKKQGFTIVREDKSDYWYDEFGNAFWTKDRSEIEEKLEEVNKEASQFYYNAENRNEKYLRVSTMKEFDGVKSDAADRGTIIDSLLRDFVDGKITTRDQLEAAYQNHPLRSKVARFNNMLINDLFGIFTDVKQVVETNGIELISNIPTLWGTIDGKNYAGTIDLLGIGRDGSIYIIDLKTASQNRRDEKGRYYDKYKKGDSIQQSAYAELIRQRTGLTVKNIVIFPIQVSKEKGQYIGAMANKDDKGNFTMPVTIDRNIFPETPGAPAAPAAPASTDAKIADIEKSKDLTKEYGEVAISDGKNVEQKLAQIGKFFKDNFGWNITYINASKENDRVEFTIDGKQVNLPAGANIRLMAGGAYAAFTMEDVINAKYEAELATLAAAPGAAPTAPAPADVKADIKNTLYPTMSGSTTLTDALPDGIYIDLGNGFFAFADKKSKIAAIVDKNNNNSVSKSFWNESKKEWQLPNRANLEDDVKRFNDINYIDKIQKATDLLNAKYDAELTAQGAAPVSTDARAEIEKKHTFTRESMDDISKGTGLTRKGSKITNPEKVESQLSVGDKIEFFAERKRTGVWNGTYVKEDGTNNPWGVLAIIGSTTGYIKNITKIEAELAALGAAPTAVSLQSVLDSVKTPEEFKAMENTFADALIKGSDYVKKTYNVTTKELTEAIEAKRIEIMGAPPVTTPTDPGTVENYNAATTNAESMEGDENAFKAISESTASPEDVMARLINQKNKDCSQ